MKYADVLVLRDHTIRDILLAKLPITDEQKEQFGSFFDKAVQAADEDLAEQLHDLFGIDADRILKRKQEAEQLSL